MLQFVSKMDGKMHMLASVGVGVVGSAALSVTSLADRDAALWFFGGALASVLLQPDLDHPDGYIGLALIRSIAGRFAAHLWHLYWAPYRLLLRTLAPAVIYGKRTSHRSWLSHTPVVGTVVRLVWMFLPVWAVSGWLPNFFFGAAIFVSDLLHYIMDRSVK